MADELIEQFKGLMTQFKQANDQAMAEHAARGSVTGETKERMVKIEGEVATILVKVGDIETGQKAIKERLSRAPVAYGQSSEEHRTFTMQLVDSEQYKGQVGTQRPHIQFSGTGRLVERKAVNPFISSTGAGWVFFPQRMGVFTEPTLPLIMRDLVDVVPIGATNAVEYVQEVWTLAADYQLLEGDKKAQSDVTYTDKTATVKTIAHYVKISRQMLADVPYLRATIESRMIYGIAMKEDKEILLGDGAAGHLHGILPQAAAYTPTLPAGFVTNQYDELYGAIMQVMMAGYAPSAIVVNPMTMAGLALAKNAQGNYILGGPPQGEATARVWGLPVAQTINMPANQFLVGAFRGNAALFDRETPNVDIAFENEDDFIRNLVCIRAEERVAFVVYVPAAFVKGTLTAPTAPVGRAEAPGPNTGKAR